MRSLIGCHSRFWCWFIAIEIFDFGCRRVKSIYLFFINLAFLITISNMIHIKTYLNYTKLNSCSLPIGVKNDFGVDLLQLKFSTLDVGVSKAFIFFINLTFLITFSNIIHIKTYLNWTNIAIMVFDWVSKSVLVLINLVWIFQLWM